MRPTARRPAAGATILPVAIEHEDLGQTVHTVALFPGDVPAGVRAARALAAKLRAGGLNAHFDVKRFGRVHPEVIAEPYLVSRRAGGSGPAQGCHRQGCRRRRHRPPPPPCRPTRRATR